MSSSLPATATDHATGEWPPQVVTKSVYQECIEEENRHKWIESEKAGYDLTTPIVVTNGELYPAISNRASGPIAHGEPLFTAISVESAAVTA